MLPASEKKSPHRAEVASSSEVIDVACIFYESPSLSPPGRIVFVSFVFDAHRSRLLLTQEQTQTKTFIDISSTNAYVLWILLRSACHWLLFGKLFF